MAITPVNGANIWASITGIARRAWMGDSNVGSNYPLVAAGIPARRMIIGLSANEQATIDIIGLDANNNVVFGDGSTVSSATVNLTAANILAMGGAPITVIAAPGTGKVIIVKSVLFEMTTTATQFAAGAAVHFYYHGGTVDAVTGAIPAATVNAAAGTSNTLLGPAVVATGTVVPANTGVDITTAGGVNFTTGTGTAKIQIQYSIVTL